MPIFTDLNSPLADQLLEESAQLGDANAALFLAKQLISRGQELASRPYFIQAADAGLDVPKSRLGEIFFKQGNYADAIAHLGNALDSGENEAGANLVRALIATGRLAELDNWIEKIDIGIYHFNIPWLLYWAGQAEKARILFEKSYRATNKFAAIELAMLFLLTDLPDKAKRWIDDAISSQILFAHVLEGDYYLAKNDIKKALESYLKVGAFEAHEDSFNEVQVLAGLRVAKIWAIQGKAEKSRVCAERVSYIGATYVFSYWGSFDEINFPYTRLLVDDYSSRVIDLDIGIQTTNGWCNWGIAYWRHGLIDEAIEKLENALAQENKYSEAEASFFLSKIYESKGELTKSEEMRKRCEAAGGYKPNSSDKKLLNLSDISQDDAENVDFDDDVEYEDDSDDE